MSEPVASTARPRVILLGKPGCHLCDQARTVVAGVCARAEVAWTEQSILDDPALFDQWWERIPVVLIDGNLHQWWRVDPQVLAGAL